MAFHFDDAEDSQRLEQLIEALTGEDDLGIVVRAHIYVEAALNDLVASLAPNAIHLGKLDYGRTIQLALILGMSADFEAPLKKLGSLRNSFAHNITASLTDQAVDAIYQAFSERLREFIRTTFEHLAEQSALYREAGRFDRLHATVRFQLTVVGLWFGLRVALLKRGTQLSELRIQRIRSIAYEAGRLEPFKQGMPRLHKEPVDLEALDNMDKDFGST